MSCIAMIAQQLMPLSGLHLLTSSKHRERNTSINVNVIDQEKNFKIIIMSETNKLFISFSCHCWWVAFINSCKLHNQQHSISCKLHNQQHSVSGKLHNQQYSISCKLHNQQHSVSGKLHNQQHSISCKLHNQQHSISCKLHNQQHSISCKLHNQQHSISHQH